VLFDSGRVVREALTGIVHRAATGSMKFVLGGEFSYPSFNGIVSGLAIRFEDAGFLPTTDSLNLLTKQLLPKPQRNEMPMR
jgi:hypothetical protein